MAELMDGLAMSIDDDGQGVARYPSSFLDIVMKVNNLDGKIENITEKLDSLIQTRNENHFTRKDIVTYIIGAIAGSSAVFGGVFFLIGTQVMPVQNSLTTFQTSVYERFTGISESIKQMRAADLDFQKQLGEQALHNARIEDRLSMSEDRQRHEQH